MNPKWVYYAIQLLEGFGMGSFFPIYTPWLESHGLNFFKMGYVNFIYHISSSALDPFTGFIADKFGKRKSFILGQIFWTATQYIYGYSTQISGFILAEGVAAMGNSMKSDALESWLQNKLGEKESSRVMGRSRPLFTIGQITTSILAGYIAAKFGMKVAWLASGTFFLVATILGSLVLAMGGSDLPGESNAHEDSDDTSLRKIFALVITNKKIKTVGLLVAIYSFAAKPMFMYWPQLVVMLQMPVALRGWTILAISIPTMVGNLMAGHNKIFTRDTNGLSKILVFIGSGLLLASIAKNLVVFLLGLIVLEVAYGSVKIVVYGHLYDEVQNNHRSTVNSMISASRTLGGAVSLLFMGKVADLFSLQTTLAIGGILVLLIWVYYIKEKK